MKNKIKWLISFFTLATISFSCNIKGNNNTFTTKNHLPPISCFVTLDTLPTISSNTLNVPGEIITISGDRGGGKYVIDGIWEGFVTGGEVFYDPGHTSLDYDTFCSSLGSITWNGKNTAGEYVPTGSYIIKGVTPTGEQRYVSHIIFGTSPITYTVNVVNNLPVPSPTPTGNPNPSPTPSLDPKIQKKCDKKDLKLDEIENSINTNISTIRTLDEIIQNEYSTSTPNLDRIRETDIKINQLENLVENLLNEHRIISKNNPSCTFNKLIGLNLDENTITTPSNDPNAFSFGTQANLFDVYQIVEGDLKILSLGLIKPFLSATEYINITGNVVIKKNTDNSVIARYPINESLTSTSPYKVKVSRVWYGRNGIGVGNDLADINGYTLDLEPIITTNVKGGVSKIDLNRPNLLVNNKYPSYKNNGIPKIYLDNGFHILARHQVNFLTTTQKSKFEEVFKAYLEASKKVASSNIYNNNEGKRENVLRSNYTALIESLTGTESLKEATFSIPDPSRQNKIIVSNIPTKGSTCYDLSWSKQSILDTVENIANLNSSKDRWKNGLDSNNSGIGIIGERNSTIIEVFVDNNTSNKITTGYPKSGKLIKKQEIQNFYVTQFFGSLFDYKDKNVILNLNSNYDNLNNLDG